MKRISKRAAAALLCAALLCPGALAAEAGYTDVPETAWYSEAADYCRETGLMQGTGANQFSPNGTVTRGMLAAVLHRLAGTPTAAASSFTDVPADSWYAGAVDWASENGYMTGYGGGLFGPEDPVTREQAAAVLWRYMGSPTAAAPDFTDEEDISSYAAAAVDWARSAGVIHGMEGGRFVPGGKALRSQLAMMLMNLSRLGGITDTSVMDVLCQPCSVALMEDGSLLVTDTYNQVIWQVSNGASTIYAGGATVEDIYGRPLGGYHDAALKDSYFKTPWGLAPFLDGWAVADADNNVIRLLRPEGVETLNGHTSEKLTVGAQGVVFQHPTGLASDNDGNLYVSDTFADAVRKISPDGEVTTVASHVLEPMGLCWHDGALYIAESGADRIVKLENGRIVPVAGSGEPGFTDGPAAQAEFAAPQGVAVGADGTVYVADTDNSAIRQIKDGQVTTLAARDVTNLQSFFPISPSGLLVQGKRLYICDPFARKLFILPL